MTEYDISMVIWVLFQAYLWTVRLYCSVCITYYMFV